MINTADDNNNNDNSEEGQPSSLAQEQKDSRIGAMILLCETGTSGETQRWLAGPYWNMLLITYVYIALTTALTFFLVATFTEFPYFFVLGMALAIVTLVALSLTAFRDPGIFPSHSRPIGPHWSYSNQAQSFRPPNVIYCRECKLLIEDYENFCPWVGTVIAKNNSNSMKVFVASFVCLMAICTAALSCSIAQAGATATSAKGLLVLPLIGIFIVLIGVVMRTARPPRKTPAERVRARATAAANNNNASNGNDEGEESPLTGA